jgi:hypothetical protein
MMIEALPQVRRLLARHRLQGIQYSIIGNYCRGAHVYQRFGIPYATWSNWLNCL